MFQIGEPVQVKNHIPFFAGQVGKVVNFHDGDYIDIKLNEIDHVHVRMHEAESLLKPSRKFRVSRKSRFCAGKVGRFRRLGGVNNDVVLLDSETDRDDIYYIRLSDIEILPV
jgi:hypothetical protein